MKREVPRRAFWRDLTVALKPAPPALDKKRNIMVFFWRGMYMKGRLASRKPCGSTTRKRRLMSAREKPECAEKISLIENNPLFISFVCYLIFHWTDF